MRDIGSDGLQKLTSTYLPLRLGIGREPEEEEKVRSGASLPISKEWLPIGIEDDKNAAKINDNKKYFVSQFLVFVTQKAIQSAVYDAMLENGEKLTLFGHI